MTMTSVCNERKEHSMIRVLRPGFALLIAAAISLPAWAHDGPHGVVPTDSADVQTNGTYGAEITEKKPVKLAKLVKSPSKYKGKTVRLEGTVKDVCQGQGCWIEIESEDGKTFLAKSLDESVLVPKNSKGQNVVVQGVVTQMPPKPHEHHGEEGHSCPAPTWVVSMLGVELSTP
jgi:hypothetical protein